MVYDPYANNPKPPKAPPLPPKHPFLKYDSLKETGLIREGEPVFKVQDGKQRVKVYLNEVRDIELRALIAGIADLAWQAEKDGRSEIMRAEWLVWGRWRP